MYSCKMHLVVIVAVITLAQVIYVDASLNLLPILRNGKVREIPDNLESSREIGRSTLSGRNHNNDNVVFDDVISGDADNDDDDDKDRDVARIIPHNSLELLTPIQYAHEDQRVREVVDSVVVDLINQFVKYEMDRRHQERSTQQQPPSPLLRKRLWGQRRNVQTRFASFGSKLSPNRKMGVSSSRATILRYGRSTRHE